MKKPYLLFAALFIGSCLQGFSQVDLHNGLKGYYPFSGNANDMSGNSRHGTVNGATLSADRNGAANSAYSFDGSTASINNVDFSTASFTAMTFSAWIKSEKTSPRATIMQQGGGVMYTNLLADKKLTTAFDGTGNNQGSGDVSTSDVVTGGWVHVAATNDGSTTKQYVNGVLESTYSETYYAASNGLYIGLQVNGMWGFQGSIDEIYIYNRAINAAEVSALYNGGLSGIEEVKNEQIINIYPNPAADRKVMVDMKRPAPGSVVTLYSPEGKQVYSSALQPKDDSLQYSLDFGTLPAGVYILSLRSGEMAVTKRIVLL